MANQPANSRRKAKQRGRKLASTGKQRRSVRKWRESVQQHTKRTLSLQASASASTFEACVEAQSVSPFFTRLPAEVRLLIYEFALAQHDDERRPYGQRAQYYRPGYHAHHKTDTALLRTCRLAWLEAQHLPMALATHTFWFFNGPFDDKLLHLQASAEDAETLSEVERYEAFFASLTPLNKANVKHVHVFASSAWLSGLADPLIRLQYFGRETFKARELTITIRDFDWSSWKLAPLAEPHTRWLLGLLSSPAFQDIQRLSLELEIYATERQTLEEIVAVLSRVKSRYYRLQEEREVSSWTKAFSKLPHIQRREEEEYCVITLHWRAHGKRDEEYFAQEEGDGLMEQATPRHVRHRGGRRSQAVWYRNHGNAARKDEAEKEVWTEESAAEVVLEQWEQEGVLLTLR